MNDTDIATLALLRDRIRAFNAVCEADDYTDTGDAWALFEDIESDLADIVKRHTPRSVSIAGRDVTSDELAADGLEIVVTGYDEDDRPMYGVGRVSHD